jgi:hypothetical protein
VRHGHGPQRAIQTGIGPVEVRRAKVRDRGDVGAEEKIRFTSSILPKWARRTKNLDGLLSILYLRGVSIGDFQEALCALLGKDAPNLSPSVIARLTAEWQADYDAWQKRDLSAAAIRVCVGGRRLPTGAHGRERRMHARADRGHPRGQEGTRRFPDRGAGERAELARAPDRHQTAWARDRAGSSMRSFPAPALLGSQDRQRAGQGRLSVQINMKVDLREIAKTWRRLKGENQLPKVVQGVKFQDGIEVIEMPAHHAA